MQPKTKNSQDNHWSQYRRPTGSCGRIVAENMNKDHWDLTTWGLKHLSIKPNSTTLDVGCGGGKTIRRLAMRSPQGKVYGIDHSIDMVDYSRQVNTKLIRVNRVEIFEGSIEKSSFKDEFFDLVTAIETYYFWPNLAVAFREIKRILKIGGKLLLINEMVKDGAYEVENSQIIAKTHVHLVPLQEMQTMLSSAGFSAVKVHRKKKSNWNVIVAQK
jgi:ubiquinone/menaquinone biosynthesis C-methylase UbiE